MTHNLYKDRTNIGRTFLFLIEKHLSPIVLDYQVDNPQEMLSKKMEKINEMSDENLCHYFNILTNENYFINNVDKIIANITLYEEIEDTSYDTRQSFIVKIHNYYFNFLGFEESMIIYYDESGYRLDDTEKLYYETMEDLELIDFDEYDNCIESTVINGAL